MLTYFVLYKEGGLCTIFSMNNIFKVLLPCRDNASSLGYHLNAQIWDEDITPVNGLDNNKIFLSKIIGVRFNDSTTGMRAYFQVYKML